MRINNNISAVNTLNAMQQSDAAMSKSLERLSSGLRITRAADDAAGLAISEKMRNQVKGLNQARRNAQDGISLIQTAEGALNETHSILNRMRELTVQASNDTLTSDDRAEIQKEMNLLIDETDRISTDTEFNTKKLLNGDASSQAKAATTYNEKGNAVTGVKATSTAEVGTYKLKFNTQAASKDMGTITKTVGFEASFASVTASLDSAALASTMVGEGKTTLQAGTFYINDKEIKIGDTDSVQDVLNKINNSGTGVAAAIDGGNLKIITNDNTKSSVKFTDGTSNFASNFGLTGTISWDQELTSDDDNMLTGATAGAVRLVDLENSSDTNIGLTQTDVISISGKVGGEEKSTSFTVGTSSVKDLLSQIENTFGGVTATIERQRTSKASTDSDADFNESKTTMATYGVATAANNLTINGKEFSIDATDTIEAALKKINDESGTTGVTASIDWDTKGITFSSANNVDMVIGGAAATALNVNAANDTNRIVIRGKDGASNAVTNVSIKATDASGQVNRNTFNSQMSFTQQQVARDKGDYAGVAQLNSSPSFKFANATAVKLESVNKELVNGVDISIGKQITASVNDEATVSVGNTDGSVHLQIGANKNQVTTLSISDMGSVALGLKTSNGVKLSVTTRDNAKASLDKIDAAISKVSSERSKLGATQNRLEHTITSLGVTSENLTASESRIRDLDMAQEMSNFTRNQILMQAGTAMMGQANQKSQGVMRLLG